MSPAGSHPENRGLFIHMFFEKLLRGLGLPRNNQPAPPPAEENQEPPLAPHPDYLAFEMLVDTARGIAASRKKRFRDSEAVISWPAWKQQYCATTINLGRSAGYTHYIRTHASYNDLIIVSNSSMAAEHTGRARIIPFSEIGPWLASVGCNLNLDTVYIEGCSSRMIGAPISLWQLPTEEYVILG